MLSLYVVYDGLNLLIVLLFYNFHRSVFLRLFRFPNVK